MRHVEQLGAHSHGIARPLNMLYISPSQQRDLQTKTRTFPSRSRFQKWCPELRIWCNIGKRLRWCSWTRPTGRSWSSRDQLAAAVVIKWSISSAMFFLACIARSTSSTQLGFSWLQNIPQLCRPNRVWSHYLSIQLKAAARSVSHFSYHRGMV